MSKQTTLLMGGIAAFASVVVWLVLFAVEPELDFENPSALASTLIAVGSLATLLVFVALWRLLSGGGASALLMALTAAVGVILSAVPQDTAYRIGSILWGIGLVLSGYLMLTQGFPRVLAWIGVFGGIAYIGAGAAGLAEADSLNEVLAFAAFPPTFVWTPWVGALLIRTSRTMGDTAVLQT